MSYQSAPSIRSVTINTMKNQTGSNSNSIMHDINAKYQRHFLAISIDPMTIEGESIIRTKMNTAKAFLASTNEYNATISRQKVQ